MKKLLLTFVLGASLASCTAAQVTSVTSTLIDEADQIIITSCNAFPEVASLISLVNAGYGATASALAAAFCSAIQGALPTSNPTPAPASLAARKRRLGLSVPVHVCTAAGICGWK